MLQKQTMYGLGKSSSSSSSKDLTKGVRKSMQPITRTSQNENPFALRDRDLNQSAEKRKSTHSQQDRSAKKSSATLINANHNNNNSKQ